MADFSQSAPKGTVLVTCPLGAVPVLSQELAEHGFRVEKELPAAVEIKANLSDCLYLNLHLRTANRVQYLIRSFTAATPRGLYNEVSAINWDAWVRPDGYLSISSSVVNDAIRDTRFANVTVKDAIVDQIRRKHGQRPDSGPEPRGVVLFLHWRGDDCRLYVDTSGEPLSRRGYRKLPWKAPMQETLAAAALMFSRWDTTKPLVNPMCGSGTLAIEGALMAMNTAPGLMRDYFCFQEIPGYDESAWSDLLAEAEEKEKDAPSAMIIATDNDAQAVETAKKNARAAGVEQFIEFAVCDFAETDIPEQGEGIVIMNPAYGERLGDKIELEQTYSDIGDFFKQACSGYTGYVFTGDVGLSKRIGLRPSRRIPLHNATIECRLLEYEMYQGTRKKQ